MNKQIYKYHFDRRVSLQEVEDSLMLAVLAVECLHGRAAVRLDASFLLNKGKRACVVDGSCQVGRDIACIFTGFLSQEFRENAFRVERVDESSRKEPNNWQRIPGLFNRREAERIKKPGREYHQKPRGKDRDGEGKSHA